MLFIEQHPPKIPPKDTESHPTPYFVVNFDRKIYQRFCGQWKCNAQLQEEEGGREKGKRKRIMAISFEIHPFVASPSPPLLT